MPWVCIPCSFGLLNLSSEAAYDSCGRKQSQGPLRIRPSDGSIPAASTGKRCRCLPYFDNERQRLSPTQSAPFSRGYAKTPKLAVWVDDDRCSVTIELVSRFNHMGLRLDFSARAARLTASKDPSRRRIEDRPAADGCGRIRSCFPLPIH